MVFVPSVNTPLGTYVQDGLRAGPSYSNLVSTTTDNNGNLISGYYDKFGKGILYSPFNTWDIVPYGSTVGNIVATTAIAAAGYLTLSQDYLATNKILGTDGVFYVQFDWPRVPSVTVSGAAMAGPTPITMFGSDWFGYPLQHTYTVNAVGTYPSTLATPAKAFYRLYNVYSAGPTGAGGTISVQTTNTFGLPYVIKESSYAANFSWNGVGMATQSGEATLVGGTIMVNTPAVLANSVIQLTNQALNATAAANAGTLYVGARVARTSFVIDSNNAADVSTVGWSIVNGGQNITAPADTTPISTATTGDVRGLIKLPEAGETWGAVPDGSTRLVYTPYIFGSDQFHNQLAAGGQPQGTGAVAPATNTVPTLKKEDLYGVSQYYTGAV